MIIGRDIIESRLIPYVEGLACDAVFLVCQEPVMCYHEERLSKLLQLVGCGNTLRLKCDEPQKELETVSRLWGWLAEGGATRSSLMILVGGGALTDLGGFVAATYMRGVRTICVPTTLLSMVDASSGGKTGINFAGVKNLVGAFHLPEEVFIDVYFLNSLPSEELLSGYAEVIKTALLEGQEAWGRIRSIDEPLELSCEDWAELIASCVAYKEYIVEQDPRESGLRRVLNLGHTIAHALEAQSHDPQYARGQRPLLHGEAVAIGMVVELYLTYMICRHSSQTLRELVSLVREHYRYYSYTCEDYPDLIGRMRHDKKNRNASIIRFVGLLRPGETIDLDVQDEELIREALDFYRETFG